MSAHPGAPGLIGRVRSFHGRSALRQHACDGQRQSSSRMTQSNALSRASGLSMRLNRVRSRRAAVVSHLASMLEAPAGRRGLFGQGVLCGTLAHVVGVDLDVLIVLGMSEGAFPPTGVSAALLSETERGAIGSPLQRGARATDERRTYLSALGAAPTRWLLHPRAGSERVAHPSPWLDGTSSNERMIESFDAELARPSEPSASLQEHDLSRAASVAVRSARAASACRARPGARTRARRDPHTLG